MTLPTIGALSIVGAALGIYLGKDAIAQIDPVYYSVPESSFHADLVPYRGSGSDRDGQPAVRTAGFDQNLGSSCIGCGGYLEEYRPRHDPAVDGYEDGWSASARTVPAHYVEAAAAAKAPQIDPERAAIVRYSSYPVTQQEAGYAYVEGSGEGWASD